jgi:hypothetical protein
MPTTKMERHKRAIHCGREKENEDVQSDKRMRYKNGDKLIDRQKDRQTDRYKNGDKLIDRQKDRNKIVPESRAGKIVIRISGYESSFQFSPLTIKSRNFFMKNDSDFIISELDLNHVEFFWFDFV